MEINGQVSQYDIVLLFVLKYCLIRGGDNFVCFYFYFGFGIYWFCRIFYCLEKDILCVVVFVKIC